MAKNKKLFSNEEVAKMADETDFTKKKRVYSDEEVADMEAEGGIEAKDLGQDFGQTKAMATGLAQGVTLDWGDEALSAISPELGEKYKQTIAESQEKHPVEYYGSEMIAPNPISKIKKLGTLVKILGTGAVMGSGMDEEDRLGGAVKGAGTALLGAGAGKVASKFGKSILGKPETLLSKELQVRPKTVMESTKRMADPVQVLDKKINKVYDKGLFKGRHGIYDIASDSWIMPKKMSRLDNIGNPDRPEVLRRLEDSYQKLNNEAESIITKHSPSADEVGPVGIRKIFGEPSVTSTKTLPSGEVKKTYGKAKQIGEERLTVPKGVHTAETLGLEHKDKVNDLRERLHLQYPEDMAKVDDLIDAELKLLDTETGFTVREMHERKKNIYQKISNAFREQTPLDPTKTAVDKEMAKFYKDVVNEEIPDMKKINSRLEDVFSIDEDLQISIIGETLGEEKLLQLYGSPMYQAYQGSRRVRDMMNVGRAKAGKVIGKVYGATPDIMKGNLPVVKGAVQMTPQSENSREPQSMENDPFISATYPRTTQDVIEHKDSFLAKVEAMEPEHLDNFAHILNMPEQQASKILPQMAQKFPHLFEYDEYHRFDGVVPQDMRPEAIKKIWAQPMSNTEKTGLIDKLNRTGELEI